MTKDGVQTTVNSDDTSLPSAKEDRSALGETERSKGIYDGLLGLNKCSRDELQPRKSYLFSKPGFFNDWPTYRDGERPPDERLCFHLKEEDLENARKAAKTIFRDGYFPGYLFKLTLTAPTPQDSALLRATAVVHVFPSDEDRTPEHDASLRRAIAADHANEARSLFEELSGLSNYTWEKPGLLNRCGRLFDLLFTKTNALEDIDKSISAFDQACSLSPSELPLRISYLRNAGRSYERRYIRRGKLEDCNRAIQLYELAVEGTSKEDPAFPIRLAYLAGAIRLRSSRIGNSLDLEKSISLQEHAIQLLPHGHKRLPEMLTDQGRSWISMFENNGDLDSISKAISILQQANQLDPENHICSANLGAAFLRRFERVGDIEDIQQAVGILEVAVKATPPGHRTLSTRLNNLGLALRLRFDRTEDISDMHRAKVVLQGAIDASPDDHPQVPICLDNLGCACMRCFDYSGVIQDIDDAIAAFQKGLHLLPRDHPQLPSQLNNLGLGLRTRFERTGNTTDILEAIFVLRRAVQCTSEAHPNLPVFKTSLGSALMRFFERTGNLTDIEEAIKVLESAVELTSPGHPQLAVRLNTLGVCLARHSERTGNLDDISKTISYYKNAIQQTPQDHPQLPMYINNLGAVYLRRFERAGDSSDINEGILLVQKAIQETPEGHPQQFLWTSNLAKAFKDRFDYSGDPSDIHEAIGIGELLMNSAPPDHPQFPIILHNLALACLVRYNSTADPIDIQRALVSSHRATQCVSEEHVKLPLFLSTLGVALMCRFQVTGDDATMTESISVHRRAIKLVKKEDHASLPLLLQTLGLSLATRFAHSKELDDIKEGISSQQKAVELVPQDHPYLVTWRTELGSSFESLFLQTGQFEDIVSAIAQYRGAATSVGSPSSRLIAARYWADCAYEHDPANVEEAWDCVFSLLAQVAGLGMTVEKRHRNLLNLSNIASTAAANALSLNNPDAALEWLEHGRCLVWNQINQLRTPLDDLRAHDAAIADRLLIISRALETAGSRRELSATELESDEPLIQRMALQDQVNMQLKLAREWDELLAQVRNIPEFRHFLRPQRAVDLLSHLPTNGIIVIINVHRTRSDALALIHGRNRPIHIPLPLLVYEGVEELQSRLREYLSQSGVRARDVDRGIRRHVQSKKATVLEDVLRGVWLAAVKPIFDALNLTKRSSNLPHFRWCPTGPLAFLPIHAAGIYREGGSCVSDFAISSYTPNVTTLLEKLKGKGERPPSTLLLVSQPNTPNLPAITGTTKETETVQQKLIAVGVNTVLLEAEDATVERVKQEMALHNWIHLACHAMQDTHRPLYSGFYLQDGCLDILEIMKQRDQDTDFAFLSACQTSTGDENLSEEAVHLAAGMLAAGYRGVVATMWSIKDEYGPVIAENFYESLLQQRDGVHLDSNDAAYALQYAVRRVREKLGDTEQALLTWVPYVHFGV